MIESYLIRRYGIPSNRFAVVLDMPDGSVAVGAMRLRSSDCRLARFLGQWLDGTIIVQPELPDPGHRREDRCRGFVVPLDPDGTERHADSACIATITLQTTCPETGDRGYLYGRCAI